MQERMTERAHGKICDGLRCILIPLVFATIYTASWAWLIWYVNEIGNRM